MPGARISQAHGTMRPIDPETGARDALVFAMYHPAAALRTPAIERESYADIAGVPTALIASRERRAARERTASEPEMAPIPAFAAVAADVVAPQAADPAPHPDPVVASEAPPTDQLTLF